MHRLKTRALGEQTEPVMLFGGAYGNIQALEALMEQALKNRITPHRIISTGNNIAPFLQPDSSLSFIRSLGIETIMGVMEELGAMDAPDGILRDMGIHLEGKLSAPNKAWLAGLPQRINFSMEGKTFYVVHGAYTQPYCIMNQATPWNEKQLEFAAIKEHDCDTHAIIAGFSEQAFAQKDATYLWMNPGIIGLPLEKSSTPAWYALLKPSNKTIDIEFHPLYYDMGATISSLKENKDATDALARLEKAYALYEHADPQLARAKAGLENIIF